MFGCFIISKDNWTISENEKSQCRYLDVFTVNLNQMPNIGFSRSCPSEMLMWENIPAGVLFQEMENKNKNCQEKNKKIKND